MAFPWVVADPPLMKPQNPALYKSCRRPAQENWQ
jgi:hypothetical protein